MERWELWSDGAMELWSYGAMELWSSYQWSDRSKPAPQLTVFIHSGASWESECGAQRGVCRARGQGWLVLQDCSNVSGTRGSRKDEALTSSNPNCPF